MCENLHLWKFPTILYLWRNLMSSCVLLQSHKHHHFTLPGRQNRDKTSCSHGCRPSTRGHQTLQSLMSGTCTCTCTFVTKYSVVIRELLSIHVHVHVCIHVPCIGRDRGPITVQTSVSTSLPWRPSWTVLTLPQSGSTAPSPERRGKQEKEMVWSEQASGVWVREVEEGDDVHVYTVRVRKW